LLEVFYFRLLIKDTIELINVDHSNPLSYMPIMIQAAGVVGLSLRSKRKLQYI